MASVGVGVVGLGVGYEEVRAVEGGLCGRCGFGVAEEFDAVDFVLGEGEGFACGFYDFLTEFYYGVGVFLYVEFLGFFAAFAFPGFHVDGTASVGCVVDFFHFEEADEDDHFLFFGECFVGGTAYFEGFHGVFHVDHYASGSLVELCSFACFFFEFGEILFHLGGGYLLSEELADEGDFDVAGSAALFGEDAEQVHKVFKDLFTHVSGGGVVLVWMFLGGGGLGLVLVFDEFEWDFDDVLVFFASLFDVVFVFVGEPFDGHVVGYGFEFEEYVEEHFGGCCVEVFEFEADVDVVVGFVDVFVDPVYDGFVEFCDVFWEGSAGEFYEVGVLVHFDGWGVVGAFDF